MKFFYFLFAIGLISSGCSTIKRGNLSHVKKNQFVTSSKFQPVGPMIFIPLPPHFAPRQVQPGNYDVHIFNVNSKTPALVKVEKNNALSIDFFGDPANNNDLTLLHQFQFFGVGDDKTHGDDIRPFHSKQFGTLFEYMDAQGIPDITGNAFSLGAPKYKKYLSKPFEKNRYNGRIFKGCSEFKYRSRVASLQAISIPFKKRFAAGMEVEGKNYANPNPISSAFSLGIGFHIQTKTLLYQPLFLDFDNSIVALEPSQRVFTFSPFIGFETVDLVENNTNGELLEGVSHKNFVVSAGVMFGIDINTVDVGVGFGWDRAIFGESSDLWIYQSALFFTGIDKTWIGLVIGIDIIK